MMARRPEEVVEVEAKEETELEKELEMSDWLEGTRWSGLSLESGVVGEPPSSTDGRVESKVDERSRSREAGGTSWTWRLSGWFDLEGGGRTIMKVFFC
jgi:hypothetical protein